MQRVKLTIEYDGRPFAGWQRQPDQPTVQGALENAATKLDGAPVTVFGAGRTDAGVHATAQVAHLDLSVARHIRKIADALNYHLGACGVAVLSAESVSEGFNARFDAINRAYRYVIINRRAPLTFETGLAMRVPYQMDAEAMHRAAQSLVGIHDFTTFRDLACQAQSPVKSLDRITVSQSDDRILITVEARSFLHRQVRSITGSLVEVGRGMQAEGWIGEILAARNRTACGPVAPPDGLYLDRVDYPA